VSLEGMHCANLELMANTVLQYLGCPQFTIFRQACLGAGPRGPSLKAPKGRAASYSAQDGISTDHNADHYTCADHSTGFCLLWLANLAFKIFLREDCYVIISMYSS